MDKEAKMINIAEKYVVRPDHVSGVSSLFSAPGQPAMKQFEVYLIGGQTLTLKLETVAARNAQNLLLQTINKLA